MEVNNTLQRTSITPATPPAPTTSSAPATPPATPPAPTPATSLAPPAPTQPATPIVTRDIVARGPRPVQQPIATATIGIETTARDTTTPVVSERPAELVDSVTDSTLNRIVAEANRNLANTNRRLEVGVHEGTNRIMVRVMDSETDEIIRELPPEERLDAITKIKEMVGFNFNHSV